MKNVQYGPISIIYIYMTQSVSDFIYYYGNGTVLMEFIMQNEPKRSYIHSIYSNISCQSLTSYTDEMPILQKKLKSSPKGCFWGIVLINVNKGLGNNLGLYAKHH